MITVFITLNQTKLIAQTPPLPPLKAHPLPEILEKWQDKDNLGDYFSEITPSSFGYLIWSQFPVKVYADHPLSSDPTLASEKRFQQWTNAVLKTFEEWKNYFPLVLVETPENADIVILRSPPPLGSKIDPETGKLIIPRARTAQTTYEFKINQGILTHQMILRISPQLGELSVLSASRHEFGHALGIWGHSPLETDALYFSQVRNAPPISPRDINTLKKIYQQPTHLGWKIS
jgi:predicted Zn-dependent protease